MDKRMRFIKSTVLVACLALFGCATSEALQAPNPSAASRALANDQSAGWESYNRNLKSRRFSPLNRITRSNVAQMKQICVYDLGIDSSFQTGPIVIGPILYATSEKETVAIDASNCNGRVVAYDAHAGAKIWETRIGDASKGESVPAAPIAWNGLIFIGQAGGDNFGVKGRMYALDAATGKQVWETFLVPREEDRAKPGTPMHQLAVRTWQNPQNVPIGGGATWTSYTLDSNTGLLYVPGGNPAPDFVKSLRPGDNLFTNSVVVLDARTGAYKRHFSLVPEDFHDWDVSATPSLVTTKAGRELMAVTPKDGILYGYDLNSGSRLYATAITTRENTRAALTKEGTRFCPGTQGGSEWNGPAYSPQTNLIYTGTVDWCTTVRVADPSKLISVPLGQPWSGSASMTNSRPGESPVALC